VAIGLYVVSLGVELVGASGVAMVLGFAVRK
jgi:hypothetical protein